MTLDPFLFGGRGGVLGRILGREKKEFEYWQKWSSSSLLNGSFFLLHRTHDAGVGTYGLVDTLGERNPAKEEGC